MDSENSKGRPHFSAWSSCFLFLLLPGDELMFSCSGRTLLQISGSNTRSAAVLKCLAVSKYPLRKAVSTPSFAATLLEVLSNRSHRSQKLKMFSDYKQTNSPSTTWNFWSLDSESFCCICSKICPWSVSWNSLQRAEQEAPFYWPPPPPLHCRCCWWSTAAGFCGCEIWKQIKTCREFISAVYFSRLQVFTALVLYFPHKREGKKRSSASCNSWPNPQTVTARPH